MTTHPTHLTTQNDYLAAPVFTIVAEPGLAPRMKTPYHVWQFMGGEQRTHTLAGTTRKVLRWGKE